MKGIAIIETAENIEYLISSCKTDDCNTMDPSKSKSGVSSVHTFGLPLAVATIFMAVTIM
jgi:hypothetical protein